MSRRGGHTDEPLLPTGTETTGKSSCSIGRIFIALIIIAGIAVGGYFIYKSTQSSSPSEYVKMPADVAASIEALIDSSVDPCDDFYEYACGAWRKKEPTHTGRSPYVRSFNILAAQTQNQTMTILQQFPGVQDFISICVNESLVQTGGYTPLVPFFKVIDTVKDSRTFFAALGTLQRAGLAQDALLGYGVDSIDLVYRMLFASQPPSANIFRRQVNETSIFHLLQVLQANQLITIPVDQLRDVAKEYVKFEDQLLEVQAGDYGLQESNVTMQAPATLAALGIDVASYVRGLSDTTPLGGSAEPIIVVDRVFTSYMDMWTRTGAFFNGVFGAAPTYSLSAVKTYLQVHVIVNAFDALPNALYNAWIAAPSEGLLFANRAGDDSDAHSYSHRLDKNFMVPKPAPMMRRTSVPPIIDPSAIDLIGDERLDQCNSLAVGYFSDRITKQWVDKYYPKENKAIGTKLVERIYKGMGERLNEVDWLDAATRTRAIEKWQYIKANVAYDTDWDSYSDVTITDSLFHDIANLASHRQARLGLDVLDKAVNRNHFPLGTDVMVQNAYYYPNFNSINMLAGLMMEPLFGSRLPDVMNLAAYGFVIGHEITHGFDNHGRLWNGTGFEVDWWTPLSTSNFKSRAQCLIDQYFTFPVEDLFVNGNSTLGENLADLGGIGLAWRVYKQQPVIPQLMASNSTITNDQIFWLAAAQVWCSVSTPTQAKWQVLNDVHSPGKYRILGPMSNLEGFADTYKCAATSFMGRSKTEKKCSIW